MAPKPEPIRPQDIQSIDLTNQRGDSLHVLSLGAIIKQWNISAAGHGTINTVLGYPHQESYYNDHAYHGAVVGRYCNRIANSEFSIDGHRFQLASNEGENHLHGGPEGFNRRVWKVEEQSAHSVLLSLFSPDGDQGYPGNLEILLRYTLDNAGGLDISWQAKSDRDTIVSLTNHTYFNLAGCDDIRDHFLRINASEYTPTGADNIPTGEFRSVVGGILDMREFKCMAQILDSEDPEIIQYGGLDHNWVIAKGGQMTQCAELYCPRTQLLLQASSDLPGLQCYSGNHEGICLEAQHFPNSPNEVHFPSPLLRAGDTVSHNIRYQIRQISAEDFIDELGSEVIV